MSRKGLKTEGAASLPELGVEDFAAASFRVEDLIARLAAPVLGRAASKARQGSHAAQPPLPDVKQLLAHFERCARSAVCGIPVSSSLAGSGVRRRAALVLNIAWRLGPHRRNRCEGELCKLQTQVDLKAERLRRELAREEEAYQVRVFVQRQPRRVSWRCCQCALCCLWRLAADRSAYTRYAARAAGCAGPGVSPGAGVG